MRARYTRLPEGVKVSDEEMMTALPPGPRHDWHGDWNYTLRPEPPAPPPPPPAPAPSPNARTGRTPP